MLCAFRQLLSGVKIILGSQSPRRHEIFRENLGLPFTVAISQFAEDIPKSSCSGPEDYVRKTCYSKARALISTNCPSNTWQPEYPHFIITADTIVVHGDDILEKPSSVQNCEYILKKLSGKCHQVVTAVTIAFRNLHSDQPGPYTLTTFTETTQVEFCELSDSDIRAYIETGEPFDKAGGYGIQSLGSSFIKSIHGCYFNVMGFPVHRFCKEIIPLLLKLEDDVNRNQSI